MQAILGWVCVVLGGSMYLIQCISSVNFSLAQRLGLQEKTKEASPIILRSERYVAYWDLFTLIWLPVAGVLMIMNNFLWPYMALIGAAVYVDTAGREAAKNLSFRHEHIPSGPPEQQKLFFSTFIVMFVLGLTVLAYSLMTLLN